MKRFSLAIVAAVFWAGAAPGAALGAANAEKANCAGALFSSGQVSGPYVSAGAKNGGLRIGTVVRNNCVSE